MRTKGGHTYFRNRFRYYFWDTDPGCGGVGGGSRGFSWPPGSGHLGTAHFVWAGGGELAGLVLLLVSKMCITNLKVEEPFSKL